MLAQPGLGAPGSSAMMSAELDGELQRILESLYQGVEEVDDPAILTMDLSLLESMAPGMKEM